MVGFSMKIVQKGRVSSPAAVDLRLPRVEQLSHRAQVRASCCISQRLLRRAGLLPVQQNGLFLRFPYGCPEPVLVKQCILYINGAKNGVF